MSVNGFPVETLGEVVFLNRPVNGGETIYPGAFVGYDDDGYLIPIPAAASGEVVNGIAVNEETLDNSTGSDGAVKCRYAYNPIVWLTLLSAAITDVGSIVYPTSTIGAVTLTGGSGYSPVGKIIDVGTNCALVDMSIKA